VTGAALASPLPASCPSRASADLLRVVACLAVVAIHGGGAATGTWQPGSPWDATLAAVTDQVARFCVPIFVLLSGHALMARRLERPGEGLARFWQGRLHRGIWPLIVFSLLWLAIHAVIWHDWEPRLRQLPLQLVTGRTEYHLYFLPAILGCWLLFPLMARLGPGRLLPLALAWQAVLCLPTATWWPHLGLGEPAQRRDVLDAVLTLQWLPWFILGMWSATRPPSGSSPGARWASATAVVATATWTVIDFLDAVAAGASVGAAQHFHRIPVTAFAMALWWAWRTWDAPLAQIGDRGWIRRFAALTFAVYLIHPTILRAWDLTGIAQPQLRILVALAGATLIAALLDRWLPRGRMAVGLEPRRPKKA
jgi:surface polysaccharide O-acyltransferase-like enzyme